MQYLSFKKFKSLLPFLAVLFLLSSISCGKESDRSFYRNCCSSPPLEENVLGENIYIPNTFTANQDGMNDVMIVHAPSSSTLRFSIDIFKKRGKKLFSIDDFGPNEYIWDGIVDGEYRQGTYHYDLTINGTGQTFKGTVYARTSHPNKCVANEIDCFYSTEWDGEKLNFDLPSIEDCNP